MLNKWSKNAVVIYSSTFFGWHREFYTTGSSTFGTQTLAISILDDTTKISNLYIILLKKL